MVSGPQPTSVLESSSSSPSSQLSSPSLLGGRDRNTFVILKLVALRFCGASSPSASASPSRGASGGAGGVLVAMATRGGGSGGAGSPSDDWTRRHSHGGMLEPAL